MLATLLTKQKPFMAAIASSKMRWNAVGYQRVQAGTNNAFEINTYLKKVIVKTEF